jgi:hypothetical protein
MMFVYENDIPFNFAISTLEDYVNRGKDYPVVPFLNQTMAVVAFMSYSEVGMHTVKANKLTTRTLAATIESLRRAGMGRVVVVGVDGDMDQTLVEESFQRAYKVHNHNQPSVGPVTHVGTMEVAFCNGEDGKTSSSANNNNINSKVNVPKATLMGLHKAFRAAQDGQSAQENVKAWLGDHDINHWKYIYLTEFDSVLNTRPSTLKTLQDHVDSGLILLPWRFQPIPHETDVRNCARRDLFVHQMNQYFYDVHELDALDMHPDKCCDEVKGPDFKRWKEIAKEKEVSQDCGDSWYVDTSVCSMGRF